MSEKYLVFVRDPYNYDRDAVSDESAIDCSGDPLLTQQNMRDETDINVLVERFGAGVPIPEGPAFEADYDFVFNFQDSMNQVVEAQRAFMTLPSKVRARFENDPGKMMDFLEDPQNRREAEFLGLVATPPAPPVPEAPTGAPKAPEGD